MPKTVTDTIADIYGVGFTTDRVAELFGVTRRTIHRWGIGERIPTIELRENVETLGYTIDVLRQIYDDDRIMAWMLRPTMSGRGGIAVSPYRQLQAGRFDAVARHAEKTVAEPRPAAAAH